MSVTEVDKENFREFPVLLVVDIADEIDLNVFYFFETLWQFEDDEDA